MEDSKTKRSKWRWFWYAAGMLAALAAALVLFAPTILVSISYPKVTIDLSPFLGEKIGALISNKTATVMFRLKRGDPGSYDIRASGAFLDWDFSAQANVAPTFRLFGVDATGSADFWLTGTEWSMHADFEASSSGSWHADIDIPETQMSESDPVVGLLVSRMQMPAVSNLTFRGGFSLKGDVGRTNELPVTSWTVSAQIKGLDASCFMNRMPVEIGNLRMGVGASGIAKHVDMRPMFPRTDYVSLSGCVLSNAFASIRATESAYLVTEAGADCCGGELKMYSFFLDSKKLNAGVTVFIDGVDAGQVLKLMKGFRGEASGKLHGKLPLQLKDGRQLKLRSAYLHSVPGDAGNLRVFDPKPVVENLAMGGVPEDVRNNVSKAIANLDYTVLKLSLNPEEDGGMALTVRLEGTATHGGTTVPVSFSVVFHGDIEQLINTGLRTATGK